MSDNIQKSFIIQEKLDFFNELGKAVVLVDNDCTIRACNELFISLYLKSDQPFTGQSFLPFICPDDWQVCKIQFGKLITGEEKLIRAEKRFKNNKGQYTWTNIIAKRWQLSKNEILIFFLLDDISALKSAREMLAGSEIKYSGLIENLPVAVFHVDLEEPEPKVYFSKQFEKLFNINLSGSDQSMTGLRKYIHPDDIHVFNHTHIDFQDERDLMVTEYRLVNDLNETFWVRERTKLVRSENNRITHIYGVMMDITSEKETRQQLRQSELKYQTLVESATDRICVLDTNSNLMYGNSHFLESLGMEPPEEYTPLSFLDNFHSNDREKHLAAMEKVFEAGNAAYEYRVRKKNGQYLYMYNKLTLLKNENGETEGILSINRDITRLKKIERELIDARKKAEESDRLKSAFLANMSHEIRTPLNGIIGFSKLLSNPGVIDKKRKLYSDIIDRNSQQLLSLITDIIDLAKIESDQLKIFPVQMNLDDLLDEIYQVFSNDLKGKPDKQVELTLSKDMDKGHSYIVADKFRLAQIFNNMLSNAIKFTESGSIEFGYRHSGKDFLFFVKDTGTGISSEYQDIIFEQFRQEDETITRKYGGTGLGLAICRKLIRLMGGKLWLESEKGKGSIFYFVLKFPLTEKTGIEIQQVVKEEVKWPGKTILIVDDNKDILAYLNEIMLGSGAKILTAESGEEAIAICNWAEKIDLVLMDMQMPGMDGYSATREILKTHPDLPVIAQTAHAMSGDDKRCINAGCIAYIPKPIDKTKLNQLISVYLNKNLKNKFSPFQ